MEESCYRVSETISRKIDLTACDLHGLPASLGFKSWKTEIIEKNSNESKNKVNTCEI